MSFYSSYTYSYNNKFEFFPEIVGVNCELQKWSQPKTEPQLNHNSITTQPQLNLTIASNITEVGFDTEMTLHQGQSPQNCTMAFIGENF